MEPPSRSSMAPKLTSVRKFPTPLPITTFYRLRTEIIRTFILPSQITFGPKLAQTSACVTTMILIPAERTRTPLCTSATCWHKLEKLGSPIRGRYLGDAANATDLSDLFDAGAVPKKP